MGKNVRADVDTEVRELFEIGELDNSARFTKRDQQRHRNNYRNQHDFHLSRPLN